MAALLAVINTVLDDGQAEDVTVIDLAGKTTIADYMVIATGNPRRHVNALAENLVLAIKSAGYGRPGVEGRAQSEWVLIDAGDVIVHVFRPEVRAFYNLEKMWSGPPPKQRRGAGLHA